MMIKNALISVSDKTGIVDFANELSALGVTIYSTGGTLKAMKDAGIPAKSVSDLTQFPEMMDGRVKTLHPVVHGGILHIRDNAEHVNALNEHHMEPIDLVVVNLYPFRETIAKPDVTRAEAIENIDIGGPTMVRAAAKNHAYVGIVVNPERYDAVLAELKAKGALSDGLRFELAKEAFTHTASYDMAIANYLAAESGEGEFPHTYFSEYKKMDTLRYGENPHQKAAFYKECEASTGLGALKQLHGKELSYNNLVDMEAAWSMATEFTEPAAVIVKHTNPCGAAVGNTIHEAYVSAYEADSVSAFGGIVALNRTVDAATANEIAKIFIEVVMAPHFTPEALDILSAKKNIRLIELTPLAAGQLTVKKISGGLLVQEEDSMPEDVASYEVVTEAQPTAQQMKDLLFAWKLVKHVKSNAILVAGNNRTMGIGAGQMNRVGAAEIALLQASGHPIGQIDEAATSNSDRNAIHENLTREKPQVPAGAVLASDAFLPFADTVEFAASYGIKAIIQPGGSIRDAESIAAANKHGITMVFTNVRHFKH